MKFLTATLACLVLGNALASETIPVSSGTEPGKAPEHRYLVQRTFPAGAIDSVDAKAKAQVNAVNARYGVHWVMSYVNPEKTRTYCVYEGPSKAAVRAAASANGLPVDGITEVPQILMPK